MEVTSTTNSSVSVSWRPGFDGGFNQTFELTVLDQRTGTQIGTAIVINSTGNDANATINHLKPYTSYLIRLIAKNKAGASEGAREVFVKTRGEWRVATSIGCLSMLLLTLALEKTESEEEAVPRVVLIGLVLAGLLLVLGVSLVVALCCCKAKAARNDDDKRLGISQKSK
jgi:hypothetical protein